MFAADLQHLTVNDVRRTYNIGRLRRLPDDESDGYRNKSNHVSLKATLFLAHNHELMISAADCGLKGDPQEEKIGTHR